MDEGLISFHHSGDEAAIRTLCVWSLKDAILGGDPPQSGGWSFTRKSWEQENAECAEENQPAIICKNEI